MSKKTLIELMIEADVKWPEGANYAAQDKDLEVFFYERKPSRSGSQWHHGWAVVTQKHYVMPSLCRNWHQKLVTREQYGKALSERGGSKCISKLHVDVVAVSVISEIEKKTAEADEHKAEFERCKGELAEMRKTLDDMLAAVGLKAVEFECEIEQPTITDWRDLRKGRRYTLRCR